MKRSSLRQPWILFAALALSALAPRLRAEAILQESFHIRPGWNFIHLSAEPLLKVPHQAFVSIDWQSVWTWVPAGSAAAAGRWVAFHREAPPFLNTLQQLVGPACYALLARSEGTLTVKGLLRPERPALRGGALQLFGPALRPATPVTLAGYFSRSGVKERLGPVYEHAAGAYRRVGDGDLLRPGAAYWVFPAQDLPAPDPVRIGAGFGGLRFDAQTTLQEIEVDLGGAAGSGGGAGAAGRQLQMRAVPSADGVSTADWLEYQTADGGFAPIGAGVSVEVPPEQTLARIGLRARRAGIATSAADQAAVVEVSTASGSARVGAELSVPGLQGVWAGEALLSEVERPSFHGGGFAPAPVVSLSLIIEIESASRTRLLPCIQVEGHRDGRQFDHRMQAALFPEEVQLTGTLGSDGKTGNLAGSIALLPEHPLNPYRHRYHPEHGAGYEVTRDFALRFGAPLPEGGPESPFASVGVLTGVYEETIHGLAQEPIRARGSFRIRRLPGGTATPCPTARP